MEKKHYKNIIILLIFAPKTAAEMGHRTFKIKKKFFPIFVSKTVAEMEKKHLQEENSFTNFCTQNCCRIGA